MSERIQHALGWHTADLLDFDFKLVIRGVPVVLKNRHQVIRIGNRPSIVMSARARDYLRDAAKQLVVQWRDVFRGPIPLGIELNTAIISFLPTKQRPDASNLYQAPEDAMKACTTRCKPRCDKHAGVITDDVQIRSHDGSDRRYDPGNPRVEITITPCKRPPFEPQLRIPTAARIEPT